jgi:Flp pilus assembly protein CpaB
MTYRVKNIGLAVILAAFAGLLTIFYVANYKRHVQHGEKNVTVLVAARDIPAGTSGAEVVEQHYMTTESVARRTIVPGAFSKPDDLNNLVATETLYRGEQLTASRFGTQTELGIRAELKGTDRAVQLQGTANELLAGTLQKGDTVDVVATWETPDGGQLHSSKVIARNLLVLKAPDAPSTGEKLGSSNQDFSVQLRASDAAMQAIWYAREHGTLSLLLRPPASDAQNSPREVDQWSTLLDRGPVLPLGTKVNK